MIKYLFLSLVIIIMIAIDIVLIQEFLYQHKNETADKRPPVVDKSEEALFEKKENIQKIETFSEAEEQEIKQTVEEKVSQTADIHITEITEKKFPDSREEKIIKTDASSTEAKIKPMKAVSTVWLNLREEPRLDSEVLTVINTGDNVIIIDQKFNHWKKVIYRKGDEEYVGWVDDRYLRIVEPIEESVVSNSETLQDQ
ncbi:SH3 domain-containing protein [Persephonella sp.]